MYLSKEATNKGQSLKVKLLLLVNDKASLDTELIWKRSGFFRDQKGEFALNKVDFPENTPIYANQGSISTLKGGDYTIYIDYVILAQLICAKKLPEDFDNYECGADEVNLCVPLYNVETGEFRGLQNWLAYIMLRGDDDEVFLSYGYDEDKSNMLYSTYKQILPTIFEGTSSKKHNPMLLNERSVQEHSKMFFLLPSTMDSCPFIKIDCRYEDFQKYSTQSREFRPQDLDSSDLERRLAAKEIIINFSKDAVQVSNSNLVQNANTLLTSGNTKTNPDQELSWIGKSRKREQDKFKFTYQFFV